MKDKFNIRKSQNSFLFIIICLLISSLTKRDSYITLTSCHSKIILKINVSGNQKVLSPDYQGIMPNSVFLNGSSIELENSKEYAFSSSFNIIELNWNDDLTSCAKMFSVPKDYVLMHNKGEFYQGKIIYLPEINFASYVVKPFETLDTISKKTGQSVDAIKQKNNLESNYIFVGQKLFV